MEQEQRCGAGNYRCMVQRRSYGATHQWQDSRRRRKYRERTSARYDTRSKDACGRTEGFVRAMVIACVRFFGTSRECSATMRKQIKVCATRESNEHHSDADKQQAATANSI